MILPCLCIQATVWTLTLRTWRDEHGEERDEAEQHLPDRRLVCYPLNPVCPAPCVSVCGFYCLFFRRRWSQQFHPHLCPSSCHLTESISYMLSCCVCVCVCVCVCRTFLDPSTGFSDTCPIFIFCQSQIQCGCWVEAVCLLSACFGSACATGLLQVIPFFGREGTPISVRQRPLWEHVAGERAEIRKTGFKCQHWSICSWYFFIITAVQKVDNEPFSWMRHVGAGTDFKHANWSRLSEGNFI